jgi:UDP-N-acetylmuramyl pentapeptide phosphotransferase/UDP-N-acetylglucosamine-1-phosphate transferase
VTFAIALVVALAMTPVARRVSFALGILDRPGPLKVQREPVAYLGGAAVFVALAAALAADHPMWIAPLALATALGVADDVRTISPRVRLLAQCSVGIAAGFAVPAPGPVGVLVTAVFVVVLVNAVNLLDGMDALASSIVATSAFAFALLGGIVRDPALALGGALAGFLVYNRPPARIYLGDGGSYLIGTALALLAATALDAQGAAAWIALPLLVSVPLADTAIAILRRARSRRPLFAGDRSHVYDQLADRGWPVTRIVLTLVAVQCVSAGAGLVAWHVSAVAAAGVALGCAIAGAAVVWKVGFVEEKAAV